MEHPRLSPDDRMKAVSFLRWTWSSGRNVPLALDASRFGEDEKVDFNSAIQSLTDGLVLENKRKAALGPEIGALPNKIFFPYSRHSSYPELCHLVEAFKPRDVWPCTAIQREWHTSGA